MGRFTKLEFDSAGGAAATADERQAPDACFLQAEREYREGNFENALRYYSRALEGDRLMVEAWRRQVVMLIELGELKEAALWADKAMELFPNDPDLLAGKAVSLCRTGDASSAYRFVDQAIHIPNGSTYPWIARGEVLLFQREGHHEYCFSKAVTVSTDGWQMLAAIGRVYQFHGLYAKALEYYNRAISREPGISFVMVQSAACRRDLGLTTQARHMLQEVLRINPHNATARSMLAEIDHLSPSRRLLNAWKRLFGR